MAPVASAVEVMSTPRRESFRFRMTWIPDSIGSLSAHSFTLSAQPSKQQRHYAAQCLCSFELYHLEHFRWPLLTTAR